MNADRSPPRYRPAHRWWHLLAGEHADDADDGLRHYMTRAVFALMGVVLAGCTLLVVLGTAAGYFVPESLAIIGLIDLAVGAGWWLVRRGLWRIARFFPPALFLALGLYGSLGGLYTSLIMVYPLAMLLAGLLAGSGALWLSLVVSLALHLLGGSIHDRPGVDEVLVVGLAMGSVLVGIALLQQLWSSQLRHTLRQARAFAANLSAEMIERERAEMEIRRQAEMLATLHETALDLASHRAFTDLLRAIVVRATELLGAPGGGLYLYRPASDDLELAVSHGVGPQPTGFVLKRGEGLSGKVLAGGRPLAVADYGGWDGRSPQIEPDTIQAIVAVPIVWRGSPLGVLDILAVPPRVFGEADIALLEQFAPLAAAALENKRLYDDLAARMDELQRTQAQLVQSARLAAIGELAAGVAHELNNPLTPVVGYSDLLLLDPALDEGVRRDLQIIAREARRARDIILSLLDFARQTPSSRKLSDVNQGLQETLLLIRSQIEKKGIVVRESYAADLPLVAMDTARIKQVWLNLLTNAMHATPAGGQVSVMTQQAGEGVAVCITDTGSGIAPAVLPRIFDPFFTTRRTGEGIGLGLSVSLGIVQDHRGRIDVQSAGVPGEGSTFTVWLPVLPAISPRRQ